MLILKERQLPLFGARRRRSIPTRKKAELSAWIQEIEVARSRIGGHLFALLLWGAWFGGVAICTE
jgi:hypothetical protein